ncbi:ArsR family transcriptional regulator [Capnocytophaga haemolytica]|jgi:transcriptional regulator
MKVFEKEKQDLIVAMSELFRRLYKISPITAKILSALVIDGSKQGLSFVQLQKQLDMSKSTLSESLSALVNLNLIFYETRDGKQRKYYRSFPFDKRFSEFLENIRYEKDFVLRVINYLGMQQFEDDMMRIKKLEKLNIFAEYLTEIEKITTEFLVKID